jgi:phenylpropionate dioxygenase-like ring-hydroxylating dioxygenase large terminal subunit
MMAISAIACQTKIKVSSKSARQANPLCSNSFIKKIHGYRVVPCNLLHPIKVAETTPSPLETHTVDEIIQSTSSSAEAVPVQQLSKESFSWTKQWYPVAVAKLIDPTRPNAIQLLGKNLVVWLDNLGEWRCFEDRCPHRSAPLSEGKIWPEDGAGGTLMCSYHGWRFTGNGKCIKIPQAASLEAEQRGCNSFRSCATTYPTTEAQGIIWVWGESGSTAQEESASKPIPIDKRLETALENEQHITYVMPLFQRDLPYDYQTLLENVADPAHVPFSHHKVQGNRDTVKYGDYELAFVPETPGRISVEYSSVFGKGCIDFEPPMIINFVSDRPNGIFNSFRVHCVPTKPGFSRIISFIVTNNQKLPTLFKLIKKLPVWMDHILFRHPVLDGDNVFLHYQEQFLVEKDRQAEEKESSTSSSSTMAAWRKNYYMPARADLLVAAFKNWLDTAGKEGPWGPLHKARGYPPLVTDHRVLLNRYEQHTKNCTACKKALTWIERFRSVAAAVAAVGFGAAISATVQGAAQLGIKAVATSSVAGGAVVGLLAALAWRWLSILRQKFYFVDYDHATR